MTDPGPDPPTRVPRSNHAQRGAWAGLMVAASSAVVLTLAVSTGGRRVSWLDHPLTEVTRSWADSQGWPVTLAHVIGILSQPAAVGVLVALLALWLLRGGLLAVAGLLAISGIAGSVATRATKFLVRRERPPSAVGFVDDMTVSFPSGHSSAGIYLFLATGLVLLQLGRVNQQILALRAGMGLIFAGPLIGISRLILGAHWPSDILAGWAFGATALLAAALLLWNRLDSGWQFPTPTSSYPLREVSQRWRLPDRGGVSRFIRYSRRSSETVPSISTEATRCRGRL